MRLILGLLVAVSLVAGEHSGPEGAPAVPPHSKKWWAASVAALVAVNVLDAHSSWGRMEVNPMLRSSDGRFGGRAIGLKAGVTAGVIAVEVLTMRRRAKVASACALVNFGATGALGAAAAHNYGLRGRR